MRKLFLTILAVTLLVTVFPGVARCQFYPQGTGPPECASISCPSFERGERDENGNCNACVLKPRGPTPLTPGGVDDDDDEVAPGPPPSRQPTISTLRALPTSPGSPSRQLAPLPPISTNRTNPNC